MSFSKKHSHRNGMSNNATANNNNNNNNNSHTNNNNNNNLTSNRRHQLSGQSRSGGASGSNNRRSIQNGYGNNSYNTARTPAGVSMMGPMTLPGQRRTALPNSIGGPGGAASATTVAATDPNSGLSAQDQLVKSSLLVARETGGNAPGDEPSLHVPYSAVKNLENLCLERHVPAHATFSLPSIVSLCQYVTPGSIVVFDIDDTLLRRSHQDVALLSSEGGTVFHQFLQSNACSHLTFNEKQGLVNALGEHLRQFTLTEKETASVVRHFQTHGCYVFALTARSSSMAGLTSQSLLQLGIDFKMSSPPSLPTHNIETQTGAAIIDGIVYCNDVPKGVVFTQLLRLRWISFPILHQCAPATCGDHGCNHSGAIVTHSQVVQGHHKNVECPERTIWFVDDSLQMLSNMVQRWQLHSQQQLEFVSQLPPDVAQQIPCQGKLALVCCHYVYVANENKQKRVYSPEELQACIAFQIEQFLSTQTLVTNENALAALAKRRGGVLSSSSTVSASTSTAPTPTSNTNDKTLANNNKQREQPNSSSVNNISSPSSVSDGADPR